MLPLPPLTSHFSPLTSQMNKIYRGDFMETIPLTKLELGSTGRIKEISCNENIKRRLLDLGLIPNTPITPIMKSIAGDPIAYEVRNIILAIRKQDADKIIVFAK